MGSDQIILINKIVYYIVFLGAVVIPTLFWLWYFRYQDREHPEPWGMIEIVFVLSFFCSCLSIIVEKVFSDIFHIIFINSVSFIAINFLFYGFWEEGFKYLISRLYVFRLKAFDEPVDGVIYGITVGLGFATCENILSIIQNGISVAFTRFGTATLLHALLAGIVGYFMSLKKFRLTNDKYITLKALLAVGIIHTAYNYFSYSGQITSSIIGIIVLIFAIFALLVGMIHHLRKIQGYDI